MFYRCDQCGMVFYFTSEDQKENMFIRHAGTCEASPYEPTLEPIQFEASSFSSTYTEAGGTIEGIDTRTTVEPTTIRKVLP